MLETWFFPVMSFLFGACIGSFLNAVIYRLPREISLSASRSHCPSCDKLIYWYENIPLISFLFLRGKCSACGYKIPIHYFLNELLLGVVALLLAPTSIDPNQLWQFFFLISVFACFVAIISIDLKFYIIPNVINLYLAILFLMAVVMSRPYWHWLGGALVGALFPGFVAYAFYRLKGVEGLGGGDVKLYGALGIYLGPTGVLYNIFLSCFLGSLICGSLMILRIIDRKARIPFGPFIVITGFVQIFFPVGFSTFMTSFLSFSFSQ